jgi:hypothetical protein
MSGTEADLLALMRADCQAQNKRRADQTALDLETAGPRRSGRRPDPTDDKINEAFKWATSV